MSDGNQLPPAGETACPTYFAKRLIQQGGAGGFACRSNGHNQRSASKMNRFPKTVRRLNTRNTTQRMRRSIWPVLYWMPKRKSWLTGTEAGGKRGFAQ